MAFLFDLKGAKEGELQVPSQFLQPVRPDLIRRAVHAQASLRFQPKGNFVLAGTLTSADYFGRRHEPRQTINTGRSRLPREKLPGGRLGNVRIVPHSKGGRRAHPPKTHKIIVERINFKEKNKAICSAISATGDGELVSGRGHAHKLILPFIVDSKFEEITRASDARKALETLGFAGDLERAASGRRMRSGRAKLRKGGYRTPKSVLIVYAQDKGIWKATRNIPGVDAVRVDKLDAESLAPGGVPGRLTIWTKSAIDKLAADKLYL
ncbi:50S ribosomal protein L4 [Candidatus Micrarchaeota archaeon CG1_02_55_22]|nr:MAG: 50S ribosomal protein L4 [Candidatus Micrarchaeota archaeon CG1_02_55_22]